MEISAGRVIVSWCYELEYRIFLTMSSPNLHTFVVGQECVKNRGLRMGSTAQCVEVRKDPSCQCQTVDGQMGVGFVNGTHAPLHTAIDDRAAFSAGFSKGNKTAVASTPTRSFSTKNEHATILFSSSLKGSSASGHRGVRRE